MMPKKLPPARILLTERWRRWVLRDWWGRRGGRGLLRQAGQQNPGREADVVSLAGDRHELGRPGHRADHLRVVGRRPARGLWGAAFGSRPKIGRAEMVGYAIAPALCLCQRRRCGCAPREDAMDENGSADHGGAAPPGPPAVARFPLPSEIADAPGAEGWRSMPRLVLGLADVGAADTARAGGKAAALSELAMGSPPGPCLLPCGGHPA